MSNNETINSVDIKEDISSSISINNNLLIVIIAYDNYWSILYNIKATEVKTFKYLQMI